MDMKQKLLSFFYNRNGVDFLCKLVMWPSIFLMLVSAFIGIGWLRLTLYALALAGVIYAYFRMFSRNLSKRQRENAVVLQKWNVIKLRFRQRKTHRYYRCPKCKAVLRVPRGKGKITVICRQCANRFDKKT